MFKRFPALLGLSFTLAFASISFIPASASAGQGLGARKTGDAIKLASERLEHKFENDMREAYAAAMGVDNMSLITSMHDSECVRGNAYIDDDASGYQEDFGLAYCAGSMTSSYYGDYAYENAYLNDYVVDQDWNGVYDFWIEVNIASLTMTGDEIRLQDAYFEISVHEVKKGYSRTRSSRYRERGSDGTYYRHAMSGTYNEATIFGFDFYLDGEPVAYLERSNHKGSDACLETEPGYCGGGGKGITVGGGGGGGTKK